MVKFSVVPFSQFRVISFRSTALHLICSEFGVAHIWSGFDTRQPITQVVFATCEEPRPNPPTLDAKNLNLGANHTLGFE